MELRHRGDPRSFVAADSKKKLKPGEQAAGVRGLLAAEGGGSRAYRDAARRVLVVGEVRRNSLNSLKRGSAAVCVLAW